jgi:hypothetical protein
MNKGEWIFEYKNHIYHLQDRDDSFKKGDLFFERAGRLGPIEWDGKEKLNYHCKKIVSITKTKMSKEEILLSVYNMIYEQNTTRKINVLNYPKK